MHRRPGFVLDNTALGHATGNAHCPQAAAGERPCLKGSIVLLRESTSHFKGHVVRTVSGNSRIAGPKGQGGPQLGQALPAGIQPPHTAHPSDDVPQLPASTKPTPARVSLLFDNGELNFYACSVRLIDEPLDDVYDWRADVMR